MYNDFQKDLADGKRGEMLVSAALSARGHKITDLSDNWEYRRKDIDLLLDNGKQQTTLEIKNDIKSETTGNIFIETYNEYNQSHSKQGWFFYCQACFLCFLQEQSKTAHIVSFDDLRQSIKANGYREAITSTTKGYIVPVEDLKRMPSYFCLKV
jgi:Holliday junction resolvase-like predicted endonuclease